jgi:hypothetical protein
MRACTTSTQCVLGVALAMCVPASSAQAIGDIDPRPPGVAPIFEQPGVLTPHASFVLEPAVQYGHSSSNRLTVVGYTIIPTLFSPRIDVREVKRNATIASLTARAGITNRLEVELKVPYVYRSDDNLARDVVAGTAVDRVFQASGKALGDVELAARYQFNQGGPGRPYFVGGVRVKTRTGRDPFEVVTDCTLRCVGAGSSGTGLLLDLPTGSGFYAVEPSLTWLMPSDPAILFGTFSYMHNFKRDDVSRTLLNGTKELLGRMSPGYSFGFNVGMGLALNDKASVSLGYDHKAISRPLQNDQPIPGSVRTQVATIMVGLSYRISKSHTINVSLGGGLTRDAPDVSLMIRMPISL